MATVGSKESSSCLTPFMLKRRTGEFDLESIGFLDLSGMGLCDISCINECMGLLHLDLGNNNLSCLDPLSSLKLLKTLNITCNNLSSLEGVGELSNLSSLNLAGNMIRSIDSLTCLTKLENLTTLRLQDTVQHLSNPVCISEENYKKAVCKLLPKLLILDGERVSGKGADLYEMCDEVEAVLRDNDLGLAHSIALKTAPWNTEKLLCSSSNSMDRSAEEAEKGFRDVLLQCQKINEDASAAIDRATQALWNA